MVEFDQIKQEYGKNSFAMSPTQWIKRTNAIGVISQTGNIRDYTDLLHLVILNNLENINATLIQMNIPQSDRLIKLNELAKKQMKLLKENRQLKKLQIKK